MKLGILSDTHGVLRKELKEELKTCDYIIHAGDFGTEKCYEELKALGIPLYMVRGNCDYGHWASHLPETLAFPIGGRIFYLIHDLNKISYIADEPDVIVFGHTHQQMCYTKRGCTYLNPGSAGRPRGNSRTSMAVIDMIGTDIKCRFIELSK